MLGRLRPSSRLLPSFAVRQSSFPPLPPPAHQGRRGWARLTTPAGWASSSSSSSSSCSRANALKQTLQASVAQAGVAEEPLLAVYDDLVREGSLRADAPQRRVARRLDRLAAVLKGYTPPGLLVLEQQENAKKEAAAGAAAGADGRIKQNPPVEPPPRPQQQEQGVEKKEAAATSAALPSQVLRGMYIHGQVGTGKSLLMDLFFHHCPLRAKRRVHFHDFMLEVHARIHAWKQTALATEGRSRHVDLRPERNAIVQVARQIAREAHLLCFDEFQVTDVADALIMASLFGELWRLGVVVVATSNRAPHDLYLEGLNRPYFLPFIALLQRQCSVVDIDSELDHRQQFRALLEQSYFAPLDADAAARLDAVWLALTGGHTGAPATIPVMMGRSLRVPRACNGACRFVFADLCQADVFAADYHAVCAHFHTLVLEGVPRLSTEKHNEARRFITLVDVLYETRTRLVMSAAAPVHALFEESCGGRVASAGGGVYADWAPPSTITTTTSTTTAPPSSATSPGVKKGKGVEEEDPLLRRFVDAAQELVVPEGELASVKELAFAFQRAASRLVEMASEEYLEAHAQTRVRHYEEGRESRAV